jgi:hypothetical protein
MDWINDPKNRPFVLIGFVVLLGAAFFIVVKQAGLFSGRGGGGRLVQPPGQSAAEAEAFRQRQAQAEAELFGGSSGSTGGATSGASSTGAGAPGTPPPPSGGAPSVSGAPGAAAPEAPVKRYYPPQPTRGDPFTPLPTSRIRRVELPKILIREVKTGAAAQEEETYETIPMRMAGLLWNGSLMAILEENGQSHVVRPGDVIGRSGGGDNIKVLSIKQSSMTVQIGKRVEEVFMKPAPPTTLASAPPTTGRPGTGAPGRPPGRPGGMPPVAPPEGGGGGGAFGAQ